jgi:hypothetical protein
MSIALSHNNSLLQNVSANVSRAAIKVTRYPRKAVVYMFTRLYVYMLK